MNAPIVLVCDIIDRLRGVNLDGWNGPSADLAVRRLCETGKHIDDLTIGEVRGILSAARAEYNADYKARRLCADNRLRAKEAAND